MNNTNTLSTSETADISLLQAPLQTSESAPEWFRKEQEKAWQDFNTIPAPTRKDETWRFSNLQRLDLSEFQISKSTGDSERMKEVLAYGGFTETSPTHIFVNDRIIRSHTLSEEYLSQGVLFLSLEEALQKHSELVQKAFFQHEPKLGGAKYAALHRSRVRAGVFVYVPANVKVTTPLEVFHWIDGDQQSVFPHTLVVTEANSRVTVIDHFNSTAESSQGFACSMSDLYAGEDAQLHYICIQNWDRAALSMQINTTDLEKNASVISLNVNLGSRTARVENRSILKGTGGRSDMLAATVADEDQIFDLRTFQDHVIRECVSDLLYKTALLGKSRGIFSGIIRVEDGAHQTDAYQTNRNLILSDEAESNSLPGLEILANDVKCSHGSTTGDLNPEELFYFQARGIAPEVAKRLMVLGFLSEVFQRLENEELENYLREKVETRFASIQN